MNPRWRGAAFLMAAVAAVGIVLWLTTFFAPAPRVESPPLTDLAPQARTASDYAQLSCVHIRLANQAVQAEADAGAVREELAAARALAGEALARDARFTGLSGGVAALDEAVRSDNAAAAATGIRVALRECELVEAP